MYRPIMQRESDCVGLSKGRHFGAALHAWSLFSENELTARKIDPRFRKEDRDLNWERGIATEILVEAVKVSRHVLQKQRRRPRFPGVVASLQKGRARDQHFAESAESRSLEQRLDLG
jgi:hypothetical protein